MTGSIVSINSIRVASLSDFVVFMTLKSSGFVQGYRTESVSMTASVSMDSDQASDEFVEPSQLTR